MNPRTINPFTYKKDFLYDKWQECIYNLSYDWKSEIVSDKWFSLLDEYYTRSENFFSTWSRVENSINAIMEFCADTNKVSVNNEDLLVFASFFSYIDYDLTNCDNFLDSAILANNCCLDLEIGNNDSKTVYSLLSNLDYKFVYESESNIIYKVFRDTNLIWNAVNSGNYFTLIERMRNETKMSDELWKKFRLFSAKEMLESQPVMHTDYFFYSYSEQIQNNLLDEINSLSKITV